MSGPTRGRAAREVLRRPSVGAPLLALTVWVGWWLSTGSDQGTPQEPASPAPAAAAASLPAPQSWSSASSTPANRAAAPTGDLPEGWTEVCREAPIPPGGLDTDPRLAQPPPTDRLRAVLRADPDPRRRAAGLAMGVHATWQAPFAQEGRRLMACRGDAACVRQASGALADRRPSGAGPHLDALARLALSSDDAAIYGLAVQMCQAHDREGVGVCQQLSAAEWARRDAHHLAPWLVLATTADSDAARAEALHRASLATGDTDPVSVVFGAVAANLPAELGAPQELALWADLFGLWTAHLMPAFASITRHCEPGLLADTNRLQQCHAVAEALVTHGSSWLHTMIGARIGERVGWPEDRVARIRSEQVMVSALQGEQGAIESALGCAGRAALRRHVQDLSRLGEVKAGRALLARATPQQRARADQAAREMLRARESARAAERSGASVAPLNGASR